MIKNNLSYDNFPFEYKLQCPILKTILCYFISHDKKSFILLFLTYELTGQTSNNYL